MMSDLPVCKLCDNYPVNYHTGAFGVKHHCDDKHCTLHNVLFTEEQWRTLMGEPESMEDGETIVQVSGFGVDNVQSTQSGYMLVGLTSKGRVVLSTGDGNWGDVSPKKPQEQDSE